MSLRTVRVKFLRADIFSGGLLERCGCIPGQCARSHAGERLRCLDSYIAHAVIKKKRRHVRVSHADPSPAGDERRRA